MARPLDSLPHELLLSIVASGLDDALLGLCATLSRALHAAVADAWPLLLASRYTHTDWPGRRTHDMPPQIGDWSSQRIAAALGHLGHTQWRCITASGNPPADRGGHACCTVGSPPRAIVVHGGANGPVLHSDTYVLLCEPYCSTMGWMRLEADGAPTGRWAHSACAWGNLVVLHAGHVRGAMSDTSVLDCSGQPAAWAWLVEGRQVELSGLRPPARYGHAAAVIGDVMWVHGGLVESDDGMFMGATAAAEFASELHACTLSQPEARGSAGGAGVCLAWRRASAQGSPPSCRFGHSLTLVAGALWLFGGRAAPVHHQFQAPRGISNELYVLRGPLASPADSSVAVRWEAVTVGLGAMPVPRAFHMAAALGSRLLIFGGEFHATHGQPQHGLAYLADVWTIELPPWEHGTDTPGAGAVPIEDTHPAEGTMDVEVVAASGAPATVASDAEPLASLHLDDQTGGGSSSSPATAAGATPDTPRAWREVVPKGTRTAPPSSLAAFSVVDTSLVIFGGFNDQPDADLSQVHVVSMCPGMEGTIH
mmetsp:Transcript_32182/g.88267  ORF Transcript_32182/g.88267 Transcript_32182/m.88267 type:complete len:537 (+) Transcript_32182:72-1682(+)